MWTLWLVCLPVMVGAILLQHLATLQADGVSSIRASAVVTFLWLLIAWLWPVRRHRATMIAFTLVAALGTQVVTQLALRVSPPLSVRISAALLVQAAVTLAIYRWRLGDDNLTPHRPRDLVELFAASLIGALVVIPLAPAAGLWVTSGPFELFWWATLSTAYMFVGSACVLLLVHRGPRSEAVPTRLLDVYVQMLVTAGCLGAVFVFDHYPLTWIVLLPAIWAGMTMGPWTSAAYSLTGALAVVVVQAIPAATSSYGPSDLPSLLVLDGMMTAFVFVVLVLSLLRDLRAHLAEEVLQRREEALEHAGLLDTVFASMSEALVLLDSEGAVRLHNGAAASLLGAERLKTEPRTWLRRMVEERTFTYSYNRDGSEDGVRMLSVQLADVQYAGSGSVVAIARDVTVEQRRIEELTSFAAVAAHDLKSPLAAVQGWIEVAEDAISNDTLTAHRALARGRSATDRMSREIDDWLTYSVAREGAVQPEPVPLQPVIDGIVSSYPGGDFLVETPDSVRADPTLLAHLMVNLIGNAVKYTLPGEKPTVTVRSFPSADRDWVRIYVVDAGIGIPEGEEVSIFEPFRRATSTTENYEGSGLGLALCKRIVRRHGGTITAARNQGPGATFTITLPRA